jgi:hypothetical protein
MTYRELIDELSKLTKEQMDMDVTVHDQNDEWYPVCLLVTYEDGVLDKEHPHLAPI